MNQNKLTLGILGLGEGRSLISAAQSSPYWEIGNICDLDEKLCQTRCKEFDLESYTLSFQELLDDESIDVIGVYTPDRFHADHMIAALQAGKHVICTKPLLVNLKQAQEVLAASRIAQRHVFVGQSTRFFEPMMRQRKDYESGMLGRLITIESHYHADHRWFLEKPMTKPETFSWLFGALSHPIDQVRWFLPNIEEVMGYGTLSENGKAAGLTLDDSMHFILKANDGRIARVSGVYSSPTQPHKFSSPLTSILRCENGASQADYPELQYARSIKGSPNLPDSDIIESFEDKTAHYFRFAGYSHHAGEYQNYLDYFAESLAKGTVPKPDLQEGIQTVALMNAMEQSLETGLPVKVQDILKSNGIEAAPLPQQATA